MFGDRLRKLRKENGLTQKELGDLLNISDRVIGHYEANNHFPDGDTLKLIANYFNVSLDYLMGITNNPNRIDPDYIEKQLGSKYKLAMDEVDLEFIDLYKGMIKENLSAEELREIIEHAIKMKERYKKS